MPPKKSTGTTSSAIIIKAQKPSNQGSKQKENPWKGIDGIQEYHKHTPSDYIFIYEESFIIGGAVDRIATSASSGFVFPENAEQSTKDVLSDIDLQFIFKNLYTTGNCFLEKVRNNDGTIAELKPFLTDEVRIKRVEEKDGEGKSVKVIKYVQNVGAAEKPEFEKNDVVHVKLSSMRSRYYGDSKLGRVMPQVILLAFIEKYYTKLFEKGAIKNTIIADVDQKLSEADKIAVKTALEDYMKGIDNAFSMMLLPGDLKFVTDLNRDLNDEAFLKLRDKLIEAISIGTNIPIDVLLSNQSNRNTKTESLEELNRDIAIPLQNVFLKALKTQITELELKGISEVTLESIDTKNQKEEMDVHTGYVDSGILTPNEVREKLGFDAHDNGDVLRVRGKSDSTPKDPVNTDTQIAKIEESIEKMYKQYE